MEVYKVMFENNTASLAIPTNSVQHGDIEFKDVDVSIQWLAIECTDENTAIEIANKVVKKIWGENEA